MWCEVESPTQPQTSGLYSYLASNDFVVEKPIADLIEKVLQSRRKAFLLRGPAGVGKTMLATLIAQYLQAKLVFFQCTYGTSEDDLLYKYVPSETTKSGIKVTLGPIPLALRLSKSKKVVLLLDEFDKTRPSADALLLDVIQNFRVSLYIDEEEMVIHGDPENMIVFLTSNDMREFSEPLIRRVCMITLKPLPPERVFELLSKKFRKETAILLTQIYADTLNASLRKPATIQELYQLGEVIENNVQANLDDLLRMFIVKYDDDWKKYVSYVSSRKAYKFINDNFQQSQSNISKYYEPSDGVNFDVKDSEIQETEKPQSLLEKLRKMTVRFVEKKVDPIRLDSSDKIEVTLKAPDLDFETYTSVIKTLKPVPSDNPRKFDKFEYVMDEVTAIIAKEPLTIGEAYKLSQTINHIEAYYEGGMLMLQKDVCRLIDEATKIRYYTMNTIFLEREEESVEKVVIEKVDDLNVKVKGYFKKDCKNDVPKMLKYLTQVYSARREIRSLYEALTSMSVRNASIDITMLNDDYFRTDDIDESKLALLIENLRRVNTNGKVYVTIDCGKYYNVDIVKQCDTIDVVVGYNIARGIMNTLGIKQGEKYDIHSDMVEKIIDYLRRGV